MYCVVNNSLIGIACCMSCTEKRNGPLWQQTTNQKANRRLLTIMEVLFGKTASFILFTSRTCLYNSSKENCGSCLDKIGNFKVDIVPFLFLVAKVAFLLVVLVLGSCKSRKFKNSVYPNNFLLSNSVLYCLTVPGSTVLTLRNVDFSLVTEMY